VYRWVSSRERQRSKEKQVKTGLLQTEDAAPKTQYVNIESFQVLIQQAFSRKSLQDPSDTGNQAGDQD